MHPVLSRNPPWRYATFGTMTEGSGWDDLPEHLRDLIQRSIRLQERVVRLDDAIYRAIGDVPGDNPVGRQLGRLAKAFGGAE